MSTQPLSVSAVSLSDSAQAACPFPPTLSAHQSVLARARSSCSRELSDIKPLRTSRLRKSFLDAAQPRSHPGPAQASWRQQASSWPSWAAYGFFGAHSTSEDIRAPSAVPASTNLNLFTAAVGSSWNHTDWMLSTVVVVRAASASPAGEEKLRLDIVASAHGAARARDAVPFGASPSLVRQSRQSCGLECLSTQVYSTTTQSSN